MIISEIIVINNIVYQLHKNIVMKKKYAKIKVQNKEFYSLN